MLSTSQLCVLQKRHGAHRASCFQPCLNPMSQTPSLPQARGAGSRPGCPVPDQSGPPTGDQVQVLLPVTATH